jgi:hypothetical protein
MQATLRFFLAPLTIGLLVFNTSCAWSAGIPLAEPEKSYGLLLLSQSFVAMTQTANSANQAPVVSIVFPPAQIGFLGFPGVLVSLSTHVQIRADASDPDGSISQVQFFQGTTLIGIATNAPYTVDWEATPEHENDVHKVLTARAIDNFGAATASPPVDVYVTQAPIYLTLFAVNSPTDGGVFPSPANFIFSAWMTSTDGVENPVGFYAGTNLVGSVIGPPYTVTVSNLLEGTYELLIRTLGRDGTSRPEGNSLPITITVARLALNDPRLSLGGQFQFTVTGALPGKTNLIQASTNLLDWFSIGSQVSSTNTFELLDVEVTNIYQRFYRVLLTP